MRGRFKLFGYMKIDIEIAEKFKEAFQKVKEARNILLIAHERPDGDAVSSLCALIDLLSVKGKKFVAFCPGQPLNNLSFLRHAEKIVFNESFFGLPFDRESSRFNFEDFDLIIALDCASLERTGLAEKIRGRRADQFFIEFDHHPKIGDYANLEIRRTEAVATAEILYYFFKANKIRITKNIADCILTGILTDTGNFFYPITSGEAVGIAAEMLLRGARFSQIVKNTLHNKSLVAMKLWGLALSNLRINEKYNFAFSVLTFSEMKKFGDDEDIFDSISGFLSNLYGVKGVMFLREEKEGKIKGSLRSSHPQIDVSGLARLLGGGGHVKASGFVVEGKLRKEGDRWEII